MQSLHKCLFLYVLTSLGQNGHGHQIAGGEIVPDGQMRYMASLQDGARNHLCAGFLVKENFLITSAHCDEKKLQLVYVGYNNLEEKRKYFYINRKCKSIDSDIMLLRLNKYLQDIQPIKIRNSDKDLVANQVCSVAGWGSTDCKSHFVNELRKVNVSVVDLHECKAHVTNPPASVICAGGKGKGYCELDAGGPLVCDGEAVGLVSFNRSRNDPMFPNVYINISKKYKWIQDKMEKPEGSDCRSHP